LLAPTVVHRAIRIVCRYIFMQAISIRRVNPTDFDGRPKRQERPEIAQVERLSVRRLHMPLANTEARLGKVSDAIQHGLMSALGIPLDDFFQIVHVLPPRQDPRVA
jgi:hypothetical protein